MNKLATIQEGYVSETDRSRICSFDNEVIDEPTKPLIHQAARLWYFKEGKGVIIVDGKEYRILPNTLIAIVPWEITDVSEVDVPLQFSKVVYDYSYINSTLKSTYNNENELGELLRLVSTHPALYLTDKQAQKIDQIFNELQSELGVESDLEESKPKVLSDLYVTCKVIEVLTLYERYIDENLSGDKIDELDFSNAQGRSILTYMYSHSSEKLSLEKVAKVFFMSESSVSKHIMDLTGVSFINVLNDIRLEKAVDYLIHTDLSLNDIASLLGFVDASHISKHFQSNVGITPMEYRKYYRNANSPSFSHTSKDFAYLVTDYLYKNYATEKLNATQVAERFGISVVELNRSLLYYTEKNFDNLLNFIRINKACELLASTDDQILYIAIDVGYSNVKTFNLNFIKYKNMTPSQFRKNVTLQFKDGSEINNDESKNEN
jgi:Transcriptional regulator containing an amidase domain and an AraC-type DNA-binding HTH domain